MLSNRFVVAIFVLAAMLGLLTIAWFGGFTAAGEPAPGPSRPGAVVENAGTATAPIGPEGAAARLRSAPTTTRSAVAAPPFASVDEDGNPIAGAVRNGLVLCVRAADGTPCADVPVTAAWRKGFGAYGSDTGRTDAMGRFPTTVAEVEQFERVEVQHPRFGGLRYGDDLLVSAAEPRTVVLVVPVFAPLHVRLVDGLGAAVARGTVKCEGRSASSAVRAHVLEPDEVVVAADAAGRAEILVPIGSYVLSAEAENCSLPETVLAEVGALRNEATIVLLRAEHRIEVNVHTTLPSGGSLPLEVTAFTSAAPLRSGMPGRAGEGQYRELFVDRQDDRHHVVRAERVPWRLVVKAKGCADAVVDVPAEQTEVRVALEPAPLPPPKARLRISVVDPEGKPVRAGVRVHEATGLVEGSELTTDGDGHAVLELEPKSRVCVSARHAAFARAIAGPFDLVAGDLDVRLQLSTALTIRGRVVDGNGQAVPANVRLLRPAGVLQQLGAPSEILDEVPMQDHRTMDDGAFHFDDCSPGEHELWAFPESGGLPARKRVGAGDEVTLVLGDGLTGLAIVRGTVRDAATRVVMQEVDVQCEGGIVALHLRTGASGQFEFVARPGEARVTVRAKGYVVTTSARTVAAGQEVFDVLMPPSPVFFVRVLDAAGRPLAGAEIAVLGADGKPIELLDANGNYDGEVETTNRIGRRDLRGVPAGAIRLRIEYDGKTHEFDVPATAGRDACFDVRWPG